MWKSPKHETDGPTSLSKVKSRSHSVWLIFQVMVLLIMRCCGCFTIPLHSIDGVPAFSTDLRFGFSCSLLVAKVWIQVEKNCSFCVRGQLFTQSFSPLQGDVKQSYLCVQLYMQLWLSSEDCVDGHRGRITISWRSEWRRRCFFFA